MGYASPSWSWSMVMDMNMVLGNTSLFKIIKYITHTLKDKSSTHKLDEIIFY